MESERSSRRSMRLASSLSASVWHRTDKGESKMSKPLNVVVICCDTLRADVVDHTWEDKVAMPNLDRLRSESTFFTRAFAEALPTVPMRRGFYTGRRAFPWRHDLDDRGSVPTLMGWHAIPHEYTTLAETLCEAGVMTGLVADV